MIDMARKEILPAVSAYTASLSTGIAAKRAAAPGLACLYETGLVRRLSDLADGIARKTDDLEQALQALHGAPDVTEEAYAIRDRVIGRMDALRAAADEAETLTAEAYWPFPTYGKLLFGI